MTVIERKGQEAPDELVEELYGSCHRCGEDEVVWVFDGPWGPHLCDGCADEVPQAMRHYFQHAETGENLAD